MKKGTMWFAAALLCLLLPGGALAVTEGVVEKAPAVEMEEMQTAQVSYLPDASYYAGYGDWQPAWEHAQEWVESEFDGECYSDVEQRPRMTAGEAARAGALLTRYRAGEIAYTGESVLNKMEDVVVGVYALNPADFAAERAFVILPGPCMTDEQILAVIDAYHQLGLTFDPLALSERNCARGGGIETNRFLNEEERERHQNLARLIERGLLDAAQTGDAAVLNPKLDSRYFCGLPDFTIRPYRRTTDEEFVALLTALGYRDKTGEIDYDDMERKSRALLCGRLGAALSMELDYIYDSGSYLPMEFDAQGRAGMVWDAPGRRACGASFTYRTEDGVTVYGYTAYDAQTQQLVQASVMHAREWAEGAAPPDWVDLTQEQILAAAQEAEAALGARYLTWRNAGERTWTNWGECLILRAQLEESLWATVYIGEDGRMRGLEIAAGTLVESLVQEGPVNQ